MEDLIWYYQDVSNGVGQINQINQIDQINQINQINHVLPGVKKLGIEKSFRYVKWGSLKIPLQYVEKYVNVVTYNYGAQFGPRNVKCMRQIYDGDGVRLTVTLYNHFKKGFVIDNITFYNIIFRK